MKICIDAGHGGRDTGSAGILNKQSLKEKDITLSIALLLEQELLALDHKTYLTRRCDRTLSLQARSRYANRYKVDLFISIHCNSAYTNKAEGMETWIHPYSDIARKFARPVQKNLIKMFPRHKNRGIKEANFHVLRETKMPAMLIETEFINNPRQAKFLANEKNQKKIATAIAAGIRPR